MSSSYMCTFKFRVMVRGKSFSFEIQSAFIIANGVNILVVGLLDRGLRKSFLLICSTEKGHWKVILALEKEKQI